MPQGVRCGEKLFFCIDILTYRCLPEEDAQGSVSARQSRCVLHTWAYPVMPLMIILGSYLNYFSLASGLGLCDYIHSGGSNIMEVKTRTHKFATRAMVCTFYFILLRTLVIS